jgi:hypothetical protein
VSSEPIGHLIHEPQYGCAVYSSGEPVYAETVLPTTQEIILDFFHAVATDPNFVNPEISTLTSPADLYSQVEGSTAQGQVAEGLHGQTGVDISTPIAEDMEEPLIGTAR